LTYQLPATRRSVRLEALLLAWRIRAYHLAGLAFAVLVGANPFAEGAESHAEFLGDDGAGFVAGERELNGVLFEFGGVLVLLLAFGCRHDHSVF
jgi:multisubunit Na+/H+ antiporter MnhB subunit